MGFVWCGMIGMCACIYVHKELKGDHLSRTLIPLVRKLGMRGLRFRARGTGLGNT